MPPPVSQLDNDPLVLRDLLSLVFKVHGVLEVLGSGLSTCPIALHHLNQRFVACSQIFNNAFNRPDIFTT